MRALKLLFVSAMGFCLGMVLAGVGGLSAETYFSKFKRSESSKKIEKYWSETGLSIDDVQSFISNEKCRNFANYRKACLNAFAQNLPSLKLKISDDGKSLVLDERAERFEEQTEIEALQELENKNVDFDAVLNAIYRREEDQKKAKLSGDLINAFISVYFDAHTYITPRDYYTQVSAKVERSKYFVGLSYEKRNGDFFIQKVVKNSDADLAGLKLYDRVISINGRKLRGLTYSDVSRMLRDEGAEKFKFFIERGGRKTSIFFNRSYRQLSHAQFNNVKSQSNYGLLTLTKFSEGVCEDVKNILTDLKSSDAKGLVLDLRDNPGGRLDEASCVAGLFLGRNKKAYYIEFLEESLPNEVVITDQEQIYSGPLVVLINSRSASASETLAGALQDYQRALIVGRRSFGKGTFQESETWLMNDKITFFKTRGFYLLPSRNSTQLVGIKPDIELPQSNSERREKDYFINPIKVSSKKFAGLKKSELMQNFETKKCVKNAVASTTPTTIDDLYVATGVQIMDCALQPNKMSVAQSGESVLN